MTKPTSEIFSVFGQIERAAAEVMIARGHATKIPAERIPEEVLFNEVGKKAAFAVMMARKHVREFNELIADLRA